MSWSKFRHGYDKRSWLKKLKLRVIYDYFGLTTTGKLGEM